MLGIPKRDVLSGKFFATSIDQMNAGKSHDSNKDVVAYQSSFENNQWES
jgi:hypothetical protein